MRSHCRCDNRWLKSSMLIAALIKHRYSKSETEHEKSLQSTEHRISTSCTSAICQNNLDFNAAASCRVQHQILQYDVLINSGLNMVISNNILSIPRVHIEPRFSSPSPMTHVKGSKYGHARLIGLSIVPLPTHQIDSFIRSCNHSFIHSFIHAFFHSFIHSFIL